MIFPSVLRHQGSSRNIALSAPSARVSHITIWEQDFNRSLEDVWDKLHDGAERGPVDSDRTISTKSKHSI